MNALSPRLGQKAELLLLGVVDAGEGGRGDSPATREPEAGWSAYASEGEHQYAHIDAMCSTRNGSSPISAS
jgi:hypothetical protein